MPGGFRSFYRPSAERFRKNVEECYQKYGRLEPIYEQCVEEFRKVDIGRLNSDHRVRMVEPFLLRWGRMGRVLGHRGVKAVCRRLKALRGAVEPLRHESLLSVDLNGVGRLVIELYDDIRETRFTGEKGKEKRVGQTAASKVLHLACPDLFVMWDSGIRRGYEKHVGDGKDYLEFLGQMKHLWKSMGRTIEDIQKIHGQRATRLLDLYNWMEFVGRRRKGA